MKKVKNLRNMDQLELALFLEKMSDRYPNKAFGMSEITFDDLYNNSDIIFDLQEKNNFKTFNDLIKTFDVIVDDFRSNLDYDYTLTFEEYYQSLFKDEMEVLK